MKNKAGWVDRTETSVQQETTVDISIEDLVEQLKEFGVDINAL